MSREDDITERMVRQWSTMPRWAQIALDLEAVELFPEDFNTPEDRKAIAALRLELMELQVKESTEGVKS